MRTYVYADLSLGESLSTPTVCDCCGREGLKRTVKLLHVPTGSVVWYGVGCADKAMGVGAGESEKQRRQQLAKAIATESLAKNQILAAESARWASFLNARCPEFCGNIFKQVEKLGGYRVAKALYQNKPSDPKSEEDSQSLLESPNPHHTPNPHTGSSFDSFLSECGIKEEVESAARQRLGIVASDSTTTLGSPDLELRGEEGI